MATDRQRIIQDMPEANYLIGHADGPHYRLIIRLFYERYRAHAHYVQSDDVVAYVREVFPDYGDEACLRHLDQLEKWRLVRTLPEQMKPASLAELRRRPRTYQAERLAVKLEELRVRLETEQSAAASINPTSLDQLIERLAELLAWVPRVPAGATGTTDDDQRKLLELWSGLYLAFDTFARSVEDYLGDLPRHKPKETLDYLGFLGYREVLTRYLSGYIERLFERRGYINHLLGQLEPVAPSLTAQLAVVTSQHVRADGSRPDVDVERARLESDLRGLVRYFRPGGDVDVLLDTAQHWVADITRHARRLSEQHHGGTIREQTLLDLGRRFSRLTTLEQAQWLAQVAFGAAPPLHWRGEVPDRGDTEPWSQPPLTLVLHPVRRGSRRRLDPDVTVDRTMEQVERMLADSVRRRAVAEELAELFGPDGELSLDGPRCLNAAQRQAVLRLLYRALSRGGSVSVGFSDWSVTVEIPDGTRAGLASIASRDGALLLPRCVLRLDRGRLRGEKAAGG